MRQTTVLMDVDGVLADFETKFIALCRSLDRSIPDPLPRDTWEFHGIPEGVQRGAWELIDLSPRWWYGLTPLVDHIDQASLRKLNQYPGVDLTFVTARFGAGVRATTQDWLSRHLGIPRPQVVLSPFKGAIAAGMEARFALDDKPANVRAMQTNKTRAFLLDRPYNRYDALLTRAMSVHAFCLFVMGKVGARQ